MNCIKFLNELIMENRLSLMSIKKYFFAIFTFLGIQFFLGISFANAICDNEIRISCSEESKLPPGGPRDEFCYEGKDKNIRYWVNYFLEDRKNFSSPQAQIKDRQLTNEDSYNRVSITYKSYTKAGNDVLMCLLNHALGNSNSNNTSSNQSSSGSSSQSNKKANRQPTASQSSSSDDERVKKINDAVDQFNSANKQKDYAKALLALKIILADSQDIPQKAAATNNLAKYYNNGTGVQKDEVKAQALFEQASIAGNPDADTNICENYQHGTGGVTKNHQTAIKYCTAAASKGHVIAMAKLGYLYHAGIGTINPELGNEWICKAAKQGDSHAIGNAEILKLNCN